MRVGKSVDNIEEPDGSEGYEYALRIKGIVKDAIITLNYFYGRDDTPVTRSAGPPTFTTASDGIMVLHQVNSGYYPRVQFVGGTLARDIQQLKTSILGNVSPVLRLEAFYAIDNTFRNSLNAFEKYDELRWAMGLDWNLRVPFLNPTNSFYISPQIYNRRIMEYPSTYNLGSALENSYTTSLLISTKYLHNKLKPSFFWMHDLNNHADMYKVQCAYEHNENWIYTLGALFLNGQEPGNGFQVFENKDYLYFKISYKWG